VAKSPLQNKVGWMASFEHHHAKRGKGYGLRTREGCMGGEVMGENQREK